MKKTIKPIDAFVYYVACIVSLGSVYIARIIITVGIKKALDDE